MIKPKVLRIVQREDCKDFYSVGDDLEYYLDDIKLDNIQGIEFSSSLGNATRAVITMLVTPDIQVNEGFIVLKTYRFKRIKKLFAKFSYNYIKYRVDRFLVRIKLKRPDM